MENLNNDKINSISRYSNHINSLRFEPKNPQKIEQIEAKIMKINWENPCTISAKNFAIKRTEIRPPLLGFGWVLPVSNWWSRFSIFVMIFSEELLSKNSIQPVDFIDSLSDHLFVHPLSLFRNSTLFLSRTNHSLFPSIPSLPCISMYMCVSVMCSFSWMWIFSMSYVFFRWGVSFVVRSAHLYVWWCLYVRCVYILYETPFCCVGIVCIYIYCERGFSIWEWQCMCVYVL